jgi:glucose-6-phosphate isomerase
MPPASTPDLMKTPAWLALTALQASLQTQGTRISSLFAADPNRTRVFSLEAAGILLDYSRHLLTREVRDQLLALADAAALPAAITAMFEGESVNNTEQRPALHVALRSPHRASAQERAVHTTLDRMEAFVRQVLEGAWRGHSSLPITDVVNIGIGGSDLGPAMVHAALTPYHQKTLRCHFVSNVDPLHLEQTLAGLDAASTLFIIASKTFTTLETVLNAEAARRWVLASGVPEAKLARHFVAVSANVEKACAFGIDAANVFPMWDWVGGRYSLWSAIGLPVALGSGMASFRELLAGAHAMDEHFKNAPLADNMPVMLALLNLWYTNFWNAQSKVVLPYAQNLHLFPAFLQQLDMESLGKQVRHDGSSLQTASGSILWGSAGTNGQHSFHQLLHQGTVLIPADFIAVAHSHSSNEEQHQQLLANCLAQGRAMMEGLSVKQASTQLLAQGLDASTAAALAPHKAIPGSRPSSTLLLQELSPYSLGALIALYEHKVYVHSLLLGINAFDQWGVELGKVLGKEIYAAMQDDAAASGLDASTRMLLQRLKS